MDLASNINNLDGGNSNGDLHWRSVDGVASEIPFDFLSDLRDDDEYLKLPEPPRLPVQPAFQRSKKRDRDEHLASSSDAPLFSSDDLPSSSADNYLEQRRKRQYQRTWFEPEHSNHTSTFLKPSLTNFDKPSSSATTHRTRGPFKRAYDSGVWLGSDETQEDEDADLDEIIKWDAEVIERHGLFGDEASDFADEPNGSRRLSQDDFYAILVESAMHNIEDPGNVEGLVFPYWQKQPEDLRLFHLLQREAQKRVLDCVDTGGEDLDLS